MHDLPAISSLNWSWVDHHQYSGFRIRVLRRISRFWKLGLMFRDFQLFRESSFQVSGLPELWIIGCVGMPKEHMGQIKGVHKDTMKARLESLNLWVTSIYLGSCPYPLTVYCGGHTRGPT